MKNRLEFETVVILIILIVVAIFVIMFFVTQGGKGMQNVEKFGETAGNLTNQTVETIKNLGDQNK